jgi:hypothetical protein
MCPIGTGQQNARKNTAPEIRRAHHSRASEKERTSSHRASHESLGLKRRLCGWKTIPKPAGRAPKRAASATKRTTIPT